MTVKDSTDNWYLSWTINRQPQFKSQDKNMVLVWLYSLNTNKEGNYVKKAMRDCTGEEVCREWLYHIGVPTERIDALAHDACNTTTCFMPYINAFFQPRKESDRPKVVPDGAVNFAFIGQFAETPARHHLHHRVFHAYRYGVGLHPAGHRPRRAGGLGQQVRCA